MLTVTDPQSSEVVVALIVGVFSTIASAVSGTFAYRAQKNSKPVSNGFAKGVTSSLARIERRLDSHMEHHSTL
jgi:hypothetical protein